MGYRYGSRSRRYSAYRGKSRYGSRDAGYEAALKHIEDAKRLTMELGGTLQDVKTYFFSLSRDQLAVILRDYERVYGGAARNYAERTIDEWRRGVVQMSGQTAERLFQLLPPRMPAEQRYRLVENLWKHFGPSSKKTLRVGGDTDLETVVEAVREHIDSVVVHYKMPDQLERRFNWLSAGDVKIKQELLNHLRSMERQLVVHAARVHLPVLMDHLRADAAGHTHRLAQILKVGKHELEVLLDRNATGVRLEEYGAELRGAAIPEGNAWLGAIWVIVIAAVIVWFWASS